MTSPDLWDQEPDRQQPEQGDAQPEQEVLGEVEEARATTMAKSTDRLKLTTRPAMIT